MNAFWFVNPTTFGITNSLVVEGDRWQIVTLDLTDAAPTSAIEWRDNPRVSGLRLDPTNQQGATIELDWVTLSGDTQQAEYDVTWAVNGLPTSTYSVFVSDGEAPIEVASGLASGARAVTANLSRLPDGTYGASVVAEPGPAAFSLGEIYLGTDLIFLSGFE